MITLPRSPQSAESRPTSSTTMFQIAEGEVAYLLGSKVAPTGILVETYVIREPNMTPIVQVQIFKTSSGWVAWTGNLTRAEDQIRAKKVAELRNQQ